MEKYIHEIRDPIHVFIKLDTEERKVLDSPPFQRLRHIHQLAMTYLVYPGATHTRFEHSLGVMELASRVFDVVTNPPNVTSPIRELLSHISKEDEKAYWKKVLRMAALCHDLGHLPFSHAAEAELLPPGWSHERLTMEIILSEMMKPIWDSLSVPVRSEDVAKIAVGPKVAKEFDFDDWETILSEIITGDAFGVDRMDYLLRDSHHAGVTYGKFDHYRLIDTLRILSPPRSRDDADHDSAKEPNLGVEQGGLLSAEALLLARYYMFSQVYFHPVRRIYDIHLKDFLCEWLGDNKFPIDPKEFLTITDHEIISDLRKAAEASHRKGNDHARRIVSRTHFKLLSERNPEDIKINPEAAVAIYLAAKEKFGEENVRLDTYKKESTSPDFPVLSAIDGRIVSSLSLSETLNRLPTVAVDYVFIAPELQKKAKEWLNRERNDIIKLGKEEI